LSPERASVRSAFPRWGRVRAALDESAARMFSPENVARMRAEALATLDALERALTARAESDERGTRLCWRKSAARGAPCYRPRRKGDRPWRRGASVIVDKNVDKISGCGSQKRGKPGSQRRSVIRAVKCASASQRDDSYARTPVLPNASPVGPLSAQLRRSRLDRRWPVPTRRRPSGSRQ
jgi:hypothetical protein